jgi:hypothetical protein
MKISIRLRQLLGSDADRHGLIKHIQEKTGIERHTISAILNNRTGKVNMETLSKLCDFLVSDGYVPEEMLPGALLGRDPERFWDLLASCQLIHICVGARQAKEWPGVDYVISTDSCLQGVLLSKVSQLKYGSRVDEAQPVGERLLSYFHQVTAPIRHATPEHPGPGWGKVCEEAETVYRGISANIEKRALVTLGSIKVNPVVEVMLARAFSARPFSVQHPVLVSERSCPIFFRYRDDDPRPPSCIGGTELSSDVDSPNPGIYYESAEGHWQCALSDASHDAAFLFYCNKRAAGIVEVACGGFSARATGLLTQHLESIASRLGTPQYLAPHLHLGLYVIEFTDKAKDRAAGSTSPNEEWEFQIVPVGKRGIQRRLDAIGKQQRSKKSDRALANA